MYFSLTLYRCWVLCLKESQSIYGPTSLNWSPLNLALVCRSDLGLLWKSTFWVFFGGGHSIDAAQHAFQESKKTGKNLHCFWKLLLEHHNQATHISLTKSSHINKSVVWKNLLCKVTMARESSGQMILDKSTAVR